MIYKVIIFAIISCLAGIKRPIYGGLAGLVLAFLVGKRTGYPKIAMKPMSVMLTALGAALLWFGWYGFNGGSAFGANAIAGLAYLTTTLATAVAAMTWLLIEWLVFKKPTLLGAASGVVAGLVAITPAAGFVDVGRVQQGRKLLLAGFDFVPRAVEQSVAKAVCTSAKIAAPFLSIG